jgi:hypothetical protein
MNMLGFTAEASLHKTGGHYQTSRNMINLVASGSSKGRVISQLKGGVFHRPFGGRLGTMEDYWVCRQGCDTAYSACLATCEGTWANPKVSMNCLLCDQDHAACLQGCARDIA